MKWLGFQRVAFTSVRMDVAEIKRRAKEPHVKDLAADIAQHGEEPIQAPTIRMPGKTLLCGRDRMAALSVNKVKRVWVHVAQCDDMEARELELSEGIYRRAENRAELIAQLVALKEQQVAAEQAEREQKDPGSVSRSAQDTPRATARRQVAQAAGITVEAVRQDEARARQRAVAPGVTVSRAAPDRVMNVEAPEAAPADEPMPSLNLLGCDDSSTRAVCKFAAPLQWAIDDCDKHLRLALGALTRVAGMPVGLKLRAAVDRAAAVVRAERPESVCPKCKGLPKSTVGVCDFCSGEGFVSAERAKQAPRECLNVDRPIVIVNGQAMPYAAVRAGARPMSAAPAANGKRVRVEDSAGNDLLGQAMAAEEAELADELTYVPDDETAF